MLLANHELESTIVNSAKSSDCTGISIGLYQRLSIIVFKVILIAQVTIPAMPLEKHFSQMPTICILSNE